LFRSFQFEFPAKRRISRCQSTGVLIKKDDRIFRRPDKSVQANRQAQPWRDSGNGVAEIAYYELAVASKMSCDLLVDIFLPDQHLSHLNPFFSGRTVRLIQKVRVRKK
jgi:hypothetical protein